MKLLLLGGTKFLGPHLVEAALQRGHTVTLFHRGQTQPDLFPQLEHIHGDRAHDLSLLQERLWDAVIDTSGFVPRIVRAAVEALVGSTQHYTFISTQNVYADENVAGLAENAPLATLADETVEEVTNETYGPLKAACERVVQQTFPDRSLIVRSGLIVGPGDPTERFTYWPHRIAQGGEVLVPDRKDQPVQFIDVRDLARWILSSIESQITGAFNVTGPDYPLTFAHVLEECRTTLASNATFTWVSEAFLQEHGIQPWSELPLWILSEWGLDRMKADIHRALQAGLTFRPLSETIRATLSWDRARPTPTKRGDNLTPERESELLQLWHTRNP